MPQLRWSYKTLAVNPSPQGLAKEIREALNNQFSDYNPFLVKVSMSSLFINAGSVENFGSVVPYVFYPSIRTLSTIPSLGSTDRWLSVSKSNADEVVKFLNEKDPNEALYAQITHMTWITIKGDEMVDSIDKGFVVIYPEGAR